MSWYIYILECSDNSYYTGITTDLERRLFEHNSTLVGAKYTMGRRPVKLVYQETCTNRSEALKREYVIRKLSQKKKNG